MDIVHLRAYAKINLALDVLGKRPDGYHEVRMVMQTIGLYDRLEIKATETKGIWIRTNAPHLTTGEDNIIYKAAKLFIERFDIQKGLSVRLDKRIPIAAGMAGGSTDAAATLIGMDRLFHTGLSVEELCSLGKEIGADVPYCILGGTAVAEGIGEILTPLKDAPAIDCLVVKPGFSVSTKTVYKELDSVENPSHPDVDLMIAAVESGDTSAICAGLGNILEEVTIKKHPEIDIIKKKMLECGALGTLMSGSGPTVFGLFKDRGSAEKAYYEFKISEWSRQTYLTKLCHPGE